MDMPMKPQVVGWELSKRTKEDAIIVRIPARILTVWARYMKAKKGQMHSCSGNLATMACGMPYAIAAQVAFLDRQVIGVIGDGGSTMLMAEIITAVAYNLPIKLVIIKNNTLSQIKWEQLPAKIKANQAIKFSKALAKSEPNRISPPNRLMAAEATIRLGQQPLTP